MLRSAPVLLALRVDRAHPSLARSQWSWQETATGFSGSWFSVAWPLPGQPFPVDSAVGKQESNHAQTSLTPLPHPTVPR